MIELIINTVTLHSDTLMSAYKFDLGQAWNIFYYLARSEAGIDRIGDDSNDHVGGDAGVHPHVVRLHVHGGIGIGFGVHMGLSLPGSLCFICLRNAA